MDIREILLSYCLLYIGEKEMSDNPNVKSDDEFKWYMWRIEYATVNNYESIKGDHDLSTEDDIEEYFKEQIRCAIENFCSSWAGGDPVPYFKRYFSYDINHKPIGHIRVEPEFTLMLRLEKAWKTSGYTHFKEIYKEWVKQKSNRETEILENENKI